MMTLPLCLYDGEIKELQPGDNITSVGNKGNLTIIDADGNVYNTVLIGSTIWMKENLKTTKYNNGSLINNITDNNEWSSSISGAYCYYDNNTQTGSIYGALYNYYACIDSRSLAPEGWRLPSLSEVLQLKQYAANDLKQIGEEYWIGPNSGTNVSNFSAMGAGMRSIFYPEVEQTGSSIFSYLKEYAIFYGDNCYYTIFVNEGTSSLGTEVLNNELYNYAFSIRFVKDVE